MPTRMPTKETSLRFQIGPSIAALTSFLVRAIEFGADGVSVQCLLKRDGHLADTLDARHLLEDEKRGRRNERRQEDVANSYFKACRQGEHDKSENILIDKERRKRGRYRFQPLGLNPNGILRVHSQCTCFCAFKPKNSGRVVTWIGDEDAR